MRIGSLFSGAGGLDMAVEAVFGGTTVWHCEVNPAASKVLAAHWPDTPNLGDISQVNWAAIEPVDVLCGGFPCQDVSAAGRRAGIREGTRSGLWTVFADAIAALRPPIVVIENVRGLLNATAHRAMEPATDAVGDRDTRPVLRAIGAVLGDLSDLGYDAQWSTVSAASIGAPHRRERVFILAADAQRGGLSGEQLSRREGDRRHEGRPEPARFVGGSHAAIGGDGPGRGELSPGPSTVNPCSPIARPGGASTGDTTDAPTATGDHAAEESDYLRAGDTTAPATATPRSGQRPSSELLPTPLARDGRKVAPSDYDRHTPSLAAVDHYLPTPIAHDAKVIGASTYGRNEPGLAAIDHYLPTPMACDNTGGGQHPDRREGHTAQLIDEVLGVEQWGKYAPAIVRWEHLTRPAPSPTEPNTKGNPRLSPAFSEWMMGWPHGWVTQVDGTTRNDQLRIIGNGVVPQQAAAAITYLLTVAEVAA